MDTALLHWSINQILSLVIITTRVGPLIFFLPVTGAQGVPGTVRILFSLMIALVLLPTVHVSAAQLPQNVIGLVIFVASEVLIGVILAVFARFIFSAVETAGQMVGVQMGMGMAGTMDPQFGSQVSLVGFLWNLVAVLLFLSVNGHHIFFRTMVESFKWIAPGGLHLSQATFNGVVQGGSYMFVLAVKIMAPAGAALFFSHVAMGILAKTVPQIPILIVGLPINIAIGLIFVGLSLNYLMPLMIQNYNMLDRLLPKLVMGMGG